MRNVTAPARPPAAAVLDGDRNSRIDSDRESDSDRASDGDTRRRRRHIPPIPPTVRLTYVVFALVNLGALPLLLVYVHDVLWPSANLGLVGALQLAGALIASLTWRPTADAVLTRARIAGCVLVGAAVTLASVRAPVVHRPAEVVTLIAVTAMAMAITTIRIALLELAHRSIDERSSVRAFTLLDVVASTSVQVGLLAGGLLVSASAKVPGWAVDPYRIYIVACSVAALLAIGPLGRMSGERPVRPAADRL